MKYRYRIANTGESSRRYGSCDVCGKHASEVYIQIEERKYTVEFASGKKHTGWTQYGCRTLFGHKDCLLSARRNVEANE